MFSHLSGTQVQRTILPELESKGLITRHRCPQDADSVYRRYAFYSLNWDRIYTYARIKLECKIKAIEDTLTKVIKSLQDV